MLARPSLQPNVVAPAKPGVTLENRFGLAESRERLFAFARVRVVDTEVDERVSFRLEHMMLASDLETLVVVFQRVIKVLQLAMNPSNAVRKAREPEAVSIALGHLDSFVKGREGFGNSTKVTSGQAQDKE